MNEHEKAFVNEFISAQRRERYFGFLASNKRRKILRNRIAHALFHDLDARYVYEENNLTADTANTIQRLLKASEENPLCYVMCEDQALDGQELTPYEAERRWGALSGIVISVVPGQLVYYRPERPSDNYVLLKRQRTA